MFSVEILKLYEKMYGIQAKMKSHRVQVNYMALERKKENIDGCQSPQTSLRC